MKESMLQILDFLKEHDFPTFLEKTRGLEWQQVLHSGYTWLVAAPLLLFIILTKRFKLLLGLASIVAFVVLLQLTLPPYGDQMQLESLLEFVGGAMAIVGLNLYFLFIRQ